MNSKDNANPKDSLPIPSDDIQLSHLFPIQQTTTKLGYWEPGKKFLLNKNSEVFIIDELGEFIWTLCLGDKSVREIERLLIVEADQSESSVRTSLSTFLLRLKDKNHIIFKQR